MTSELNNLKSKISFLENRLSQTFDNEKIHINQRVAEYNVNNNDLSEHTYEPIQLERSSQIIEIINSKKSSNYPSQRTLETKKAKGTTIDHHSKSRSKKAKSPEYHSLRHPGNHNKASSLRRKDENNNYPFRIQDLELSSERNETKIVQQLHRDRSRSKKLSKHNTLRSVESERDLQKKGAISDKAKISSTIAANEKK